MCLRSKQVWSGRGIAEQLQKGDSFEFFLKFSASYSLEMAVGWTEAKMCLLVEILDNANIQKPTGYGS